jgi:hypothetical protein
MRVRERQNAAHKFAQLTRGKILFANLDHIDAATESACDMAEQGRNSAGGEAVGYVVAQHYSGV